MERELQMKKEQEKSFKIVVKDIFNNTSLYVSHITVREFDDVNQAVMEELLSIKNGVKLENISFDNENYVLFHSIEHIINNNWFESHVKSYEVTTVLDRLFLKLKEMRDNG